MRTNIVIDDGLLAEVMKLTGKTTKREAVEFALQTVLRIKRQEGLRSLRGKLRWEGDLNEMRASRGSR